LKYLLVIVIVWSFFFVVCFADEGTTGRGQTLKEGHLGSRATSQAVLTVEVTNGTAHGSTVINDEVIVQIYRYGRLLHSLEGTVSPDGKAVFEEVPSGERIIAAPSVKHQDMMFKGRTVALRRGGENISAHVKVFDVSEDSSKLSVENHHFIVEAHFGVLEITEYMQLKNSSDKAVTSKQRDDQNRAIVLRVMLPKGFKNLKSSSYFGEDALVVTERGFYDTLGVPPGEYPVTFSYTLDINSSNMDIIKTVSLPTANFIVFAELGQARLQGLGRPDNQIVRGDGTPMVYYKRSDLAPGEKIAFQITGFNVNTYGLAVWMILAAVFGSVMVLVIMRLRPIKS